MTDKAFHDGTGAIERLQRANAERSKPTPGPWVGQNTGVQPGAFTVTGEAQQMVALVYGKDYAEQQDNTALICEAGTVHRETGLTPQQLRNGYDAGRVAAEVAMEARAACKALEEQRDGLLAALRFYEAARDDGSVARDAIANAEGRP